MTSPGREVKDLESWQDAFNYPVATTRQIEKQFRSDIAANKERLRTLVGASYRDLLGTAERIVQLDDGMQETEGLLGNISLQCNLETIDKKAKHLAELQEHAVQQKSSSRLLAAQLTLLLRCQTCLPRILRRGTSILVAAKVLAISRLLIKTIGQSNDPPPILESIRNQSSSRRRRLLFRIGAILTSPKSTFRQVIDAICAFCIATSSSSSDAIRHFHDLRLDKIRRLSSLTDRKGDDVLAGFEYYLQSLRTTKELLGRQFSDALRDLQSQPILRSPDIQSLEDLDVASVQQSIPAEILGFVPWIKHQDTEGIERFSVLEKWSSVALEEFSLILKLAIDQLSDTSELLDLRTRLFQIWLPVSVATPTHSNSEIFQALRTAFNTRMKELLNGGSQSLPDLSCEIASALEKEGGKALITDSSMWDHDFVASPLGKGASAYKKQLTGRYLGQSKTAITILTSLESWITSTSTRAEEIQHVRKTRWIDVIEEDEDEDDDDKAKQIERVLQRDDPDVYQQELKSSLDTALLDFQRRIQQAAEDPENTNPQKTIYLLRLFRGIYQHLCTAFPQQDLTILSSTFPHLHHSLAANTASLFLKHVKPYLTKSRKFGEVALLHLWSGDPPLPSHPSPRTFKLLQHLTAVMGEQGPDLWSPDAVSAVKKAVQQKLVDENIYPTNLHKGQGPVNGAMNALLNGSEAEEGGSESTSTDREGWAQLSMVQNLFDLLYLSHALGVPDRDSNNDNDTNTESESETQTFTALLHRSKNSLLSTPPTTTTTTQLDPTTMLTTLERRARDYWARTALLFGLLGC